MSKEFLGRIKHKKDTSANWTSKNPVLLDGELIMVTTDSGETRFKIGDGVKTYTQLPFQDEVVRNSIPSSLSQLAEDSNHRLVTDSEKTQWNSQLTEPQVKSIIEEEIGSVLSKTY